MTEAKRPLPPSAADDMVGRLARWLVLLGADVDYLNPMEDRALLDYAHETGRLVITRDTLLGTRRDDPAVDIYFIRNDRLDDQLRQVARDFDLSPFTPFSRCTHCNVPVVEVDRDLVRHRLYPHVAKTAEHITECPSCRRLYWPGTHRENAMEWVREVLG